MYKKYEFDGTELDNTIWDSATKSEREISIENGELKFGGGTLWNGGFVITKEGFSKEKNLQIEFDYRTNGEHYSTAAVPYIFFGVIKTRREKNYLIREDKGICVMIGSHYDRDMPTQVQLSEKYCYDTNIKPMKKSEIKLIKNEKSHFKISLIPSESMVEVYVDDKRVLNGKFNWDELPEDLHFEIGSNTYGGKKTDYFDNIVLSDIKSKYFLKDSKGYYGKSGDYCIKLKKINRKYGVDKVDDFFKVTDKKCYRMDKISEIGNKSLYEVELNSEIKNIIGFE